MKAIKIDKKKLSKKIKSSPKSKSKAKSKIASKSKAKAKSKIASKSKSKAKRKIVSKSKAKAKRKIVSKSKSKAKAKSVPAYLKGVPHFIHKSKDFEVLALGTAHISKQSVKDVRKVFAAYQPDSVAVELCQPRFESLMLPNRWKSLDIAQVIKQNKIWLLASSLLVAAFQKKIGSETGVSPGAEMKTAIQLANKNGRRIILADREVRITMSRLWSRVGFFSRLSLISFLIASLFIRDKVSSDDIEKLKASDVLDDLLKSLPKRYRALREIILDERDICIAENIRNYEELGLKANIKKKSLAKPSTKRGTKKNRILAVLGAAHLRGVEKNLKSKKPNVNIAELLTVPKTWSLKTIFSFIIFSLIFLGISAIFYQSGLDLAVIQELVLYWVLSRCIGAGLGALVAYPRPSTFIATVFLAPISYFLGFVGIRLWMVSALAELRSKKPQVEDFENIATSIHNFRTFVVSLYRNRVIHLLFLILSVSWGLTIGNIFFIKVILDGLAK